MEMVSVGYNGQQFEVPAEIVDLNAIQPGVVAS